MNLGLRSALTALLVTLTACSSSSPAADSGPDSGLPPGTVSTTLLGLVVDEAGAPVAGAAVAAHGKSATTDARGVFVVAGLTVPADRCVAVFKKQGFFTGARAAIPVAGGTTPLRLTLLASGTPQKIDGAAGGKVTVGSGGSVELAAGSFTTASGAYSGEVQVSARFLDPTAPSFFASFPGDFVGQRTSGESAFLVSYGVINVALQTPAGDEVKLADGKAATLTFPVPAALQGQATGSIPLWYFDEAAGLWKEEGSATGSGAMRVGQVKHFSAWNLDDPKKRATLTGTVTCKGSTVQGVLVSASQATFLTGSDGRFKGFVPADTPLTVTVVGSLNGDAYASAGVSVGPIPGGGTQDVTVELTTPCPAKVTGKAVGCKGEPVTGTVTASAGGHTVVAATDASGSFSVSIDANQPVTVSVTALDGTASTTRQVQSPAPGQSVDLGSFTVCGPTGDCPFVDVTVSTMKLGAETIGLSPDGSKVAVTGWDEVFAELRDVKSGAVIYTLPDHFPFEEICGFEFSADGKRMLSNGVNVNPVVWDTTTGKAIQTFGTNPPQTVFLTADGKYVAGAAYDGTSNYLAKWSVDTGAEVKRFSFTRAGPSFDPVGLRAADSQIIDVDGQGSGSVVTVWDMNTDAKAGGKTLAFPLNAPTITLEVSPSLRSADGSVIGFNQLTSVQGEPGQLVFFDSLSFQQLNAKAFDYINDAALSGDGTTFVTQRPAGTGGLVEPPGIYRVSDGGLVRSLPAPAKVYFEHYSAAMGGKQLAGTYYDVAAKTTKIRVWDCK